MGDFFKSVAEDTLKDVLGRASRKLSRCKRRQTPPKTAVPE